MRVRTIFCHKVSPDDNGERGKRDQEYMMTQYPWLRDLFWELANEKELSRPYPRGGNSWSAVFLEDLVDGQEAKISLKMVSPSKKVNIPNMVFDKGALPAMKDIKAWIRQHGKKNAKKK
jgi:hypothetical protein